MSAKQPLLTALHQITLFVSEKDSSPEKCHVIDSKLDTVAPRGGLTTLSPRTLLSDDLRVTDTLADDAMHRVDALSEALTLMNQQLHH